MRTLRQEVRTIYTIEVQFKDYIKAKEAYANKIETNTYPLIYPNAFEGDDLNDFTTPTLCREFQRSNRHGDWGKFIAQYLEFDGVENHGYYKERDNVRIMVVYNNGNDFER